MILFQFIRWNYIIVSGVIANEISKICLNSGGVHNLPSWNWFCLILLSWIHTCNSGLLRSNRVTPICNTLQALNLSNPLINIRNIGRFIHSFSFISLCTQIIGNSFLIIVSYHLKVRHSLAWSWSHRGILEKHPSMKDMWVF